MTKLTKVKDHPHLYRDDNTGAIINNDTIPNDIIKSCDSNNTI